MRKQKGHYVPVAIEHCIEPLISNSTSTDRKLLTQATKGPCINCSMLLKEEFFLDGDGGPALCETVQDSWLFCLTWSAILVLARAVSDKETLVEKHSKTHTTPVEQKENRSPEHIQVSVVHGSWTGHVTSRTTDGHVDLLKHSHAALTFKKTIKLAEEKLEGNLKGRPRQV